MDKALLSDEYFHRHERHAVNATATPQMDGIEFHLHNANDMRGLFRDGSFATVLSNAMLEHDRHFWLTVGEMKRVLAPGGMLFVAVPGFAKAPDKAGVKVLASSGAEVKQATATYRVHAAPDYWRFSPQSMKNVILEGLEIKSVRVVLLPPRVIGVGLKLS